MALTELQIKKAKPTDKQQKLTDGGGMYLLVHTNGGKYWQMAYRFGGKQKKLSLGVYPDVSLSKAREWREQARRLLADGIDPHEAKKDTKRAAEAAAVNSFEVVARGPECSVCYRTERSSWSKYIVERRQCSSRTVR